MIADARTTDARHALRSALEGGASPRDRARALLGFEHAHFLTEGGGADERVFLDAEALNAYALADRERRREGWEARVRPWRLALHELFARGVTDLAVDAGEGVVARLDREDLSALAELLAETAAAPADAAPAEQLFVILSEEGVYYHHTPDGARYAFAFRTREGARTALPAMRERVPGLRFGGIARVDACRGLLEAGVSRLVIDPGTDAEHALGRAQLEAQLAGSDAPAREPAQRAEPGPTGAAAGSWLGDVSGTSALAGSVAQHPSAASLGASTGPAPIGPDELTRSLGPTAPLQERPNRDDAASEVRMRDIRVLAGNGSATQWAVVEVLARDLDLWVPIGTTPAENGYWPRLTRVDGGERVGANFYSTHAACAAALAGEGAVPLAVLCGIEAFRWIWSAPFAIADVVVDPDHPQGGLSVGEEDILSMLFPSVLPVRDLGHVNDLPIDRLASLDGVHGLKPELVRFLVTHWDRLLGPPADGSQAPISYRDGSYLPVFTSDGRVHEYFGAQMFRAIKPRASKDGPPFLSWLRLAGRCEGVVVDAGSPHAFTIDPSELFYLQIWAEERRAPFGEAVTRALARLQSGDYTIDQRTAGRIAADWPLFLAARVEGGDGELFVMPGTDELALFTSRESLAGYSRVLRNEGRIQGELEPVQQLPRWRANLFLTAHSRHSGVRIDPGLGGGGGVYLDGMGLDGALERLEFRLRPRALEFRAPRLPAEG